MGSEIDIDTLYGYVTRRAGREEIGNEEERIKNLLASKYGPPTIEESSLTAETVSLCFDAGVYVAKMFQDKNSNAQWAFVELRRPILQGFSKPRNPFDLVLSFATEENRVRPRSRMYERWTADLSSVG